MENRYWIGRKRSAMMMARDAASAEARLVHYDLAGRYSIKAAESLAAAAAAGHPGTRGEGPVLILSEPTSRPTVRLGLRPDREAS